MITPKLGIDKVNIKELKWREVEIKECFFYNQISFPFSCTCLMGMFKKTEYNPICMVFAEVFLIVRIPHSTVLITEVSARASF